MAHFQKEDACLLGCVCHIDLYIVMAFWRHNSPLKRQSLSTSWYGVTCQNTLNLPRHNLCLILMHEIWYENSVTSGYISRVSFTFILLVIAML